MLYTILTVITDNQSFFQWTAGITIAMLMTIIGYAIKGIRKEIDDNKEETAVLRAKVEVLETRIMEKLSNIQTEIATLMVLAKHDRPSLPCQEWTNALVANATTRQNQRKPNPKPKPYSGGIK